MRLLNLQILSSLVARHPMGFAGDGNVNGFGLEFYIETPGSEIADTIHDVKKSWQFQLLYTVSQLAAGAQNPGQVTQNKHHKMA